MAFIHDVSEDLYKFLNGYVGYWMISDVEEHFNMQRRNLFKDLPKSPLIHCVTPDRQRNRRYELQPCTLEAFIASLPGSKTQHIDGPADIISIERKLVTTREASLALRMLNLETEKVVGIIDYATDHYQDEPKINEETRNTLANLDKAAVAVINWLEQIKLDPRFASDDTAYAMFVMEDE